MGFDYKQAGVDIDMKANALKSLKKIMESTFTENVAREIGKFGGFYKIDEERILVASIDSVGTKVKTAKMANKLRIVGQDIVNHCVNDIAVHNAAPLFYLDYVAAPVLKAKELTDVITGIAKACKENNCALIGGETAELPGIYHDGMLDIVGVIVGILNKDEVIDGRDIQAGDVLIGIESNGIHTNGFSLVNKLFFEKNDFKIDQHIDELNDTLSNQLLSTHISYLSLIKSLAKELPIKGMAHITGGGLYDNTIRIIPKGLNIEIDYDKVDILPVFKFIQKTGDIKIEEMFRVFNMGVGLVVITEEKNFQQIDKISRNILNKKATLIGKVK